MIKMLKRSFLSRYHGNSGVGGGGEGGEVGSVLDCEIKFNMPLAEF